MRAWTFVIRMTPSILIVGAGATGGYLGSELIAANHPVTFLVRAGTLARLNEEGLGLVRGDRRQTLRVRAITTDELDQVYDVIVLAVRAEAIQSVVTDIAPAVGSNTVIIPMLNGVAHLDVLTAAFGRQRTLGASTRLAASLLADGTVDISAPGVAIALGHLDGTHSEVLTRAVETLNVGEISATTSDQIVAVMWQKFAFITATAVLSCLVRWPIQQIAQTSGGRELALAVLNEVSAVATAAGVPLRDPASLELVLTEPSAAPGPPLPEEFPSMFRDMRAGRRVEDAVLMDLAAHARRHSINTPLLDAALVVIGLHNRTT